MRAIEHCKIKKFRVEVQSGALGRWLVPNAWNNGSALKLFESFSARQIEDSFGNEHPSTVCK